MLEQTTQNPKRHRAERSARNNSTLMLSIGVLCQTIFSSRLIWPAALFYQPTKHYSMWVRFECTISVFGLELLYFLLWDFLFTFSTWHYFLVLFRISEAYYSQCCQLFERHNPHHFERGLWQNNTGAPSVGYVGVMTARTCLSERKSHSSHSSIHVEHSCSGHRCFSAYSLVLFNTLLATVTISISHGQNGETQHKLRKAVVASKRHEVLANETV